MIAFELASSIIKYVLIVIVYIFILRVVKMVYKDIADTKRARRAATDGLAYLKLNGKSVVTLYAERTAEISNDYTVIVNASPYKSVFVKGAKGKNVKTVNCMGEELRNSTINNDIEEIILPMGAMAFLK